MKKIVLLAISLLLVLTMAFGLASCKKDKEEDVTYSLDSSAFSSEVAYEGELSLGGLFIVSSEGERIPVTSSMVSGMDTLSVGAKTLSISYGESTFSVNYTVKFLVTFVVNGSEVSQLVSDASEVSVPETPVVAGKQFEGWDREVPNVLTSNIVINAIYKTLSNAREDIYTWLGQGVIDISGYAPAGSTYTLSVDDPSSVSVSLDEAGAKINYTLNSDDAVTITLQAHKDSQLVADKSWTVEKVSKPNVYFEDTVVALGLDERMLQTEVKYSSDITFKYQIAESNTNVTAF